MKRLSVRLSIVGTVLALGAAAITHSVLSRSDVTPESKGDKKSQPKVVAKKLTGDPPSPIRVEPTDEPASSPAADTLKPPPSSFFQNDNNLRPVSHESATESGISPPPATAIATDEPSSFGGGFPIAQPDSGDQPPTKPDAQTNANDLADAPEPTAEPPIAVADSSSDGRPSPPSIAPPPSDPSSFNAAPIDSPSTVPPAGLATADAPPVVSNSPQGSTTPAMTTPSVDAPSADVDSSGAVSDASSFPTAPPGDAASPDAGGLGIPTTGAAPLAAGTVPATHGNTASVASAPDRNTADSAPRDTNSLSSPATPQPAAALAAAGTGAAVGVATAGALSDDHSTTPSPPVTEYPSTESSRAPDSPVSSGSSTALADPPAGSPAASSASPPNLANVTDAGLPPSAPPAPAALGANASAGMAVAASAGGPVALMASNVPGDRQLEGQQAPAIVIEKTAPEEVQVNRPATFQLRVRNSGNAPAHNVVVVDRVPQGTKFVDAIPPVTPTADGTLVWQIDVLKPGTEVVLAMNLIPQMAGEIGSVAQATFQTRASVRTICTKPELKLDVVVPQEVLIGQPATLEITVTNTGNGAAEKVVIEEDVPEGFTHAAGRELEHEIGTLRPQESRKLNLVINSTKAGDFQNHLTVHGAGDLFDEDVKPIRVTTPQLKVSMKGPSLRYLDRQATYAVNLTNPGTAPARNVALVTYLPKGVKYVTSDNHGQYDTQSHAVYWNLEELPPGKRGDVHVTVLPIEPGNLKLKADAKAELGLQDVCEHEITVEGLAELAFSLSDVADPIEVGSETAYEIKLQNRGSKADAEIQIIAELPAGITPVNGDGPTQATVEGQRVVFGPLARLGPQEEAVFKVHGRGAVTGDHVIRVQVRSKELRVPVTKEEITRVYSDN